MMAIRNPAAGAAELTVRSPLDSSERRPHHIGPNRNGYHFLLDALQRASGPLARGDERRAGKTAKLMDLYSRLNLAAS